MQIRTYGLVTYPAKHKQANTSLRFHEMPLMFTSTQTKKDVRELSEALNFSHQQFHALPKFSEFISKYNTIALSPSLGYNLRFFKYVYSWEYFKKLHQHLLNLPTFLKTFYGSSSSTQMDVAYNYLRALSDTVPLPVKFSLLNFKFAHAEKKGLSLQASQSAIASQAKMFVIPMEHEKGLSFVNYLDTWANKLDITDKDPLEKRAKVITLGNLISSVYSKDKAIRKQALEEIKALDLPLYTLLFLDRVLLRENWSEEAFQKMLPALDENVKLFNVIPSQAPKAFQVLWQEAAKHTEDLKNLIHDKIVDRFWNAESLKMIYEAMQGMPDTEKPNFYARFKRLATSRFLKDAPTVNALKELREKGVDFKEGKLLPVVQFPTASEDHASQLSEVTANAESDAGSDTLPESLHLLAGSPTSYKPASLQYLKSHNPGQNIMVGKQSVVFTQFIENVFKSRAPTQLYLSSQDNGIHFTKSLLDYFVLAASSFNQDAATKEDNSRFDVIYQHVKSVDDLEKMDTRLSLNTGNPVLILKLSEQTDTEAVTRLWKTMFHLMEYRHWPVKAGKEQENKQISVVLLDEPSLYEKNPFCENIRKKVMARRPVLISPKDD